MKAALLLVIALAGCEDRASTPATPPSPKSTEEIERPAVAPIDPERACDAGDADACVALAKAILPSPGPSGINKAERERAAGFARKACERKHVEGCEVLAMALPYDTTEQRAALAAACDLGAIQACGDLGRQLADQVSNAADDVAKGVALLERACVAKIADGAWHCELASLTHAIGGKIAKNTKKAKELHARACEQGLLQGCPCSARDQCGDNTGLICDRGTCVTAEAQ
jgi:TPR repeat protein